MKNVWEGGRGKDQRSMDLFAYETSQGKWTLKADADLGEDWTLGSKKGNVWVIARSLKCSPSVLRIRILIILTAQSHILNPNKASRPPRHLAGAQ